jgi:hypothetical protein
VASPRYWRTNENTNGVGLHLTLLASRINYYKQVEACVRTIFMHVKSWRMKWAWIYTQTKIQLPYVVQTSGSNEPIISIFKCGYNNCSPKPVHSLNNQSIHWVNSYNYYLALHRVYENLYHETLAKKDQSELVYTRAVNHGWTRNFQNQMSTRLNQSSPTQLGWDYW